MPKQSALRIFAFSALSSLAILIAVPFHGGASALLVTLILAVIEVTFSFDNAIINAKILKRLSDGWQRLFLTAGIVVAIFGMRIVFPILVVVLTAHLGWAQTVTLALHHPKDYAHHLEQAHASIAAFGGAFLLMLALQFFFDDERKIHWIRRVEKPLSKITNWWGAPLVAAIIVGVIAVLPANTHAARTIVAAALGAATYIVIQLAVTVMERLQGNTQGKQVGWAAFTTLIYLEILDASFSFDGVIGAFAVTNDIVLIAAGLGIGALWVRSLTVFMVHKGTLEEYVFLEHGAHYTVLALAIILLLSVVWNISDFVPGLAGVGIITASIIASRRFQHARAA